MRTQEAFASLAGVVGVGGRVAIGAVFCVAGAAKFMNPSALERILPLIIDAPDRQAVVAWLLPRAEVLLGVVLVLGIYVRVAYLVSAIALVSFTALLLSHPILQESMRGCQCFGISDTPLALGFADGPWRNFIYTCALALSLWSGGARRLTIDSLLRTRARGGDQAHVA